MAYSNYKFTPEDKMMLTMVKMICQNTPPEKRWQPTMSETKSDSVPISETTTAPTKSKEKPTTNTITKTSPSGCASQSLPSPKKKKFLKLKPLSNTILAQ